MNTFYNYFPNEVLYHIFDFLTLEDIYLRLIFVEKQFSQFLSSVDFKNHLIKQILPIENHQKLLQLQINSILQSKLIFPKNIELPFWGIKTNGGCAYDNPRFWVAKAFIKSQDSMIALSKKQNALFIEGTLSYDVEHFKSLIIKIARIINLILKKDEVAEQIQFIKNLCRKISQIKIGEVFNQIFRIYHEDFQIEEALFEDFLKSSEQLWIYINKLTDALTLAIEKDPYKIEDQIYSKMGNRIAQINSIEINRNVKVLDIARTMIIYVTELDFFPNEFHLNLKNCRNEQELHHFIKLQSNTELQKHEIYYKVQKTNSMVLANIAEEFDSSMSKIDDFFNFLLYICKKLRPDFTIDMATISEIPLQEGENIQILYQIIEIGEKDLFLDSEQITYADKDLFYGFGLAFIKFKGQLLEEDTFRITTT